jgi:4-carboxymuconolactone decarboxylase
VEENVRSNDAERLRRLAVNDADAADRDVRTLEGGESLDQKTMALARLAALVAVGAAVQSFGEHADAAVSAGASADEIVDVLVGVCPVVGIPRVVAAAPKLALALGYDLDDLED